MRWEGPHSPTHWTLEEALCEQDCSPGWRDCLGQVTWAIPWSPGSLPLWPYVPVTALKPLQAPVLLSQFQPRPLLRGKIGSMPATLLGQKTPTGMPQGYWDPGMPPVISTLTPHPPLSRMNPQGCHFSGFLQGSPFSAPALKRGPIICPSPPPPWDALKDYASASDTTSLFTSNPFFPAWKLLTSLPGQENPHR